MAKPVSLQAETRPVLASSRARNLLKNKNDDMFGLTPDFPRFSIRDKHFELLVVWHLFLHGFSMIP
jgi:hypothetical protein